MGKANCLYCNSQNTFNIAYGYLDEMKDKPNYIDQEDIGLHINYRKHGLINYNFDGEQMSYKSSNYYCKTVERSFIQEKLCTQLIYPS